MIILMSNAKKKKKKKPIEETVRKGLKHSAGFTWGLLINVILVYLVVKMFSFSFNFAYSVFGNVACDPSSKEYVVVEIPADSSSFDIGKALEEKGIIDSRYVFAVKVRVKGYGDKITSGKYGLCASMTYDEILDIICHIEREEEEGK
ncbi:MAG: endolytic transglycosylase MltG [Bacteroides sp.]|nr:endolytic transglycosylase MltG [Bacteroides sp.]